MSWAEGFPGVVKGAPWFRCIETGHYAFVLDTETLTVPHFGAVTKEEPMEVAAPGRDGAPNHYKWKIVWGNGRRDMDAIHGTASRRVGASLSAGGCDRSCVFCCRW